MPAHPGDFGARSDFGASAVRVVFRVRTSPSRENKRQWTHRGVESDGASRASWVVGPWRGFFFRVFSLSHDSGHINRVTPFATYTSSRVRVHRRTASHLPPCAFHPVASAASPRGPRARDDLDVDGAARAPRTWTRAVARAIEALAWISPEGSASRAGVARRDRGVGVDDRRSTRIASRRGVVDIICFTRARDARVARRAIARGRVFSHASRVR